MKRYFSALLLLLVAEHAHAGRWKSFCDLLAGGAQPQPQEQFPQQGQKTLGQLLPGRTAVDLFGGTPFIQNFVRLNELIQSRGQEPFTIVIPAMVRTGKTSLLLGVAKSWAKSGNGIALMCETSQGPKGVLSQIKSAAKAAGVAPEILTMLKGETDIFKALETIAAYGQANGRRVLFLLDESGALQAGGTWDSHVEERFLAFDKVNTILAYAASRTAILAHFKKTIAASDVGKRAISFEPLPETKEKVVEYVQGLSQKSGIEFSADAIDALYEASGGWPYELNEILSALPRGLRSVERENVVGAMAD